MRRVAVGRREACVSILGRGGAIIAAVALAATLAGCGVKRPPRPPTPTPAPSTATSTTAR